MGRVSNHVGLPVRGRTLALAAFAEVTLAGCGSVSGTRGSIQSPLVADMRDLSGAIAADASHIVGRPVYVGCQLMRTLFGNGPVTLTIPTHDQGDCLWSTTSGNENGCGGNVDIELVGPIPRGWKRPTITAPDSGTNPKLVGAPTVTYQYQLQPGGC
jgi:hypothetical protein